MLIDRAAILALLQERLPNLLALYAFGSRVHGTAQADSDLDLAVLVAGYADVFSLFELAGELAESLGCPVDLLDFRAASTVMQYQILTTGERCWALDSQAPLYEAAVMNEYLELNQARAGLLADIAASGRVYGG